ncbi:hypothetical protein IKG49_00195 [Candidatus Saccharibacteria bacterium]|nr:hypothetical protein [Candidatus Saccharibacteria bacterium]
MSVKEYYYEHLDELSLEKQFHFATRMKNFFNSHDFDDFLEQNKPDTNIAKLLSKNDCSMVANYEKRKKYFEKYPDIYGLEAALFRVHHLLKEYRVDIRDELTKLYPKNKMYELSDRLMADGDALITLSSWAVNTICLIEELFPRDEDMVAKLGDWVLRLDADAIDPVLLIYFCTHIIICESEFYTQNIKNTKHRTMLINLLNKCKEIILNNIDTISLDPCIEYLVCCRMLGVADEETAKKVNEICKNFMQNSPYLINYRRDSTPDSYYHTLDGAEHINALYIMSGLDELNSL